METDHLTQSQADYIKGVSEIVIARGVNVDKELVIRVQGQTVLYFVRHNGNATQWGQFRNAVKDYNSRS